ncbi:MAG TPA: protein kinase [Microvirga sp.]|nr:protein kinase [Microvirga sp.]
MSDLPANADGPIHYLALPPGAQLFEFRIEAVLGHGGFGITYLATDTLLQEQVAIKEYLPNELAIRISDSTIRAKSSTDQQEFEAGLKSFLEEARAVARFRHPNIVHVRRFFEMHGSAYIVQDYIKGQTLSKLLGAGPLPEPVLRNVLKGILDGLKAVHDRATLHRDLKPNNIILRDDGTPVLIDFGAARDFGTRHSRSVTAIAAPGYSPPEQYGVGGQQGPWTDLYALGAIAYRCVTGTTPPDSLRRLRNDPLVPAVTAAAGHYDPALLRLIDWMLSIVEEDRPSSVADVVSALDKADGIAPTSGQAKFDEETKTIRTSPRGSGRAAEQSEPGAARGPAWLAWAAAVLLLAVAGAGIGFYVLEERRAEAWHREMSERFAAAGFDAGALDRFLSACGVDCPEDLRRDAEERLALIRREEASYRSAGDDPGKLRAYAQSCTVCAFRHAATDRAGEVEQQQLARRLSEAGTSISALEALLRECGAACPETIARDARSRLDVLQNEERQYRAAAADPERLRSYARDCRMCVYRSEATQAADRIESMQRESNSRLAAELNAAGMNAAALERFYASCQANCPPDLRQEAGRRLGIVKDEEARYRSVIDNPEGLRSYVSECRACRFKTEAERRIAEIDALERERLLRQLRDAQASRTALERFLNACTTACPQDIRALAQQQLEKHLSDEAAYHRAQNDPDRLRAYAQTCTVCAQRDQALADAERISQERERLAARQRLILRLTDAGTDIRALEQFVASCGSDCPADLQAQASERLQMVKRQRDELARKEAALYLSATGDATKLQAYIALCVICDNAADARRELTEIEERQRRLQQASQEEQVYREARGDSGRLQSYLTGCRICAYRDAALSEKAELETEALGRSEEQAYRSAGNDVDALRRYLASCQVCAFAEAARNEIADAERQPEPMLPSGSYLAERGYNGPKSRTDPTNCPSTTEFDVSVDGETLSFEGMEQGPKGSYLRTWTGSIDQATGRILVRGTDADPPTKSSLVIAGHYADARIESGYCGVGFFRIQGPQ